MKQHKAINYRDILYNYDNLKDYKRIMGKDQKDLNQDKEKNKEEWNYIMTII